MSVVLAGVFTTGPLLLLFFLGLGPRTSTRASGGGRTTAILPPVAVARRAASSSFLSLMLRLTSLLARIFSSSLDEPAPASLGLKLNLPFLVIEPLPCLFAAGAFLPSLLIFLPAPLSCFWGIGSINAELDGFGARVLISRIPSD